MSEFTRNHVAACKFNRRELDQLNRMQPMRTSTVDWQQEQILDALHKRRTAGMLQIKGAQQTRDAQMKVWEQQRLREAETRRRSLELRKAEGAEKQEVRSGTRTLTALAESELTARETAAHALALQQRRLLEESRSGADTARRAESNLSRVRDAQRCAHNTHIMNVNGPMSPMCVTCACTCTCYITLWSPCNRSCIFRAIDHQRSRGMRLTQA